jgi:four helix bundle protein
MDNQQYTHFTDLLAWQVGHELVLKLYKVTTAFPAEERFGISSQVRRAGCSVTANIAEGFGRFYFRDKQKFYYYARGSTREIQSFLLIAHDLGYLSNEQFENINNLALRVNQLINGLIRSIEEVTMK